MVARDVVNVPTDLSKALMLQSLINAESALLATSLTLGRARAQVAKLARSTLSMVIRTVLDALALLQ